MKKNIFLVICFGMLVFAGNLWAGCGACTAMPESSEMKECGLTGTEEMGIEGDYVRLGGQKYGIKVEEGKIYSFVENERSGDLIKGDKFKGKNIVKLMVWGEIVDDKSIDVERYRICIEEKKGKDVCEDYVWCVKMQKMSELSEGGGSFEHNGQTYWYCCPPCKEAFDENPEKYLEKEAVKSKEGKEVSYVCPMKCHTSSEPGKCPKCGMEMKKLEK